MNLFRSIVISDACTYYYDLNDVLCLLSLIIYWLLLPSKIGFLYTEAIIYIFQNLYKFGSEVKIFYKYSDFTRTFKQNVDDSY